MKTTEKLLILQPDQAASERGLDFRAKRVGALEAVSQAGAEVRHDSGGRFLLIDASRQAGKALLNSLPEARLVSVKAGVKLAVGSMDPTERLFLEALEIRASERYREAKRQRRVGDTPEEQELVSAPDVRNEY